MMRPTPEDAVTLLREKQVEKQRLPQKGDFDVQTVFVIKSLLGPWPRALEQAGLKEVSRNYLNKKLCKKRKHKRH